MRMWTHGTQAGLALLVAGLSTGCVDLYLEGSGRFIEEERPTAPFERLEVEDHIQVHIVVDPAQAPRLRVVGDDNLVERLRTDFERDGDADTLRVYFPGSALRGWESENPLRVDIVTPRMRGVSCSGGSRVDVAGEFEAERFRLSASGGCQSWLRDFVAAAQVDVSLSGGAEAIMEGTVERATASLSGDSALKARDLQAREAALESSGGSTAVIGVNQTLRVSASGGSHIRVLGRPRVLEESLSGGSTLVLE
ncbi:DUF2807 domain-containing protein [Myxococcus stipitatus]|uniref:head GIN domain-containing protein n=1 Tax=Myxococcus stipitatus TaxID=83455 RepID=UPI001F3B45AA|nr:head GIN domain-containing protein [Myxococcus stipitatus]MCE9670418.1 DUF2807 domain-containing protein [Myxococcus stipitatus]